MRHYPIFELSFLSVSPPINAPEFEIISKLIDLSKNLDPNLKIPIGDDAAVLHFGDTFIVISTDALVQDVHFDLNYFDLNDIAHKAVGVNASDIAAMGAELKYLLVTIASPKSVQLAQLLSSLKQYALDLGATLIGGDLSSSEKLMISITAIGTMPNNTDPMLRSGAVAGDSIMVSGPLGGSNFGLRCLRANPSAKNTAQALAHLRPSAQLELGRLIARAGVRCAIDVSDGMLADLEHIALASQVGIELQDVPIFSGATIEDALFGGEDYQLIFTTNNPKHILEACANAHLFSPTIVGVCTSNPETRTLGEKRYTPRGYTHDF